MNEQLQNLFGWTLVCFAGEKTDLELIDELNELCSSGADEAWALEARHQFVRAMLDFASTIRNGRPPAASSELEQDRQEPLEGHAFHKVAKNKASVLTRTTPLEELDTPGAEASPTRQLSTSDQADECTKHIDEMVQRMQQDLLDMRRQAALRADRDEANAARLRLLQAAKDRRDQADYDRFQRWLEALPDQELSSNGHTDDSATLVASSVSSPSRDRSRSLTSWHPRSPQSSGPPPSARSLSPD